MPYAAFRIKLGTRAVCAMNVATRLLQITVRDTHCAYRDTLSWVFKHSDLPDTHTSAPDGPRFLACDVVTCAGGPDGGWSTVDHDGLPPPVLVGKLKPGADYR